MNASFLLILILFLVGCKTSENALELAGAFIIENQLLDSEYRIVGNLNLRDGQYQFVPDQSYPLDNFKNEFYFQNPRGSYDIQYRIKKLTNLEDHQTLGTVNFIAPNKKKHLVLLRFDRDHARVYFHSKISRLEIFSISRPLK